MRVRHALLLLWLVGGGCSARDGDAQRAAKDSGATPASALLESVKGPVALERAGKKAQAQLGYLYLGDALETADDGEARVRFTAGRVVDLGPEGRFEIREGEGGLVLSVAQGLVLTRTVSSAPAQPLPGPSVQLTILTPFGFTRVARDEAIDLELTVTPRGATVEVKLGAVDLVSLDGKVTQVRAGQNGSLGKVLELETIHVTITAGGGRAELKRRDEARWVALPKKPVALAEGDSFRVKDGRVVMQAPGGEGSLAFARGSEVTMEKAAKDGVVEAAGFDFKKGELTAQAGAKTRLNLSDGVTLSSEAGSQFVLKRTTSGYQLESVAGDVKVERGGADPATVPGGSAAIIPAQGAVSSEPLPREPIALPSRTAMKVLHTNAGRFSITWEGQSGQPYLVDVAEDPGYRRKVVSGQVHQPYVSVPAPVKGALFWRVFGPAEEEIARGSASFAPEPTPLDLARNRNEVHDGAEQTTIFFQDKPPSVTFTWQPSREAQRYKVQVYRKEDLTAPVVEKLVSEDKVMLPEGGLGEGSYMWSVKFLDGKGAEVGGTGKMNKLVITYDNAVPNLAIKAPKNGDPGGPKVRCQGIAPVGAKVQVNGRTVPLDEKSRFDTEVAPTADGLLVFRMVNGGSEVYTVRRVRKGK